MNIILIGCILLLYSGMYKILLILPVPSGNDTYMCILPVLYQRVTENRALQCESIIVCGIPIFVLFVGLVHHEICFPTKRKFPIRMIELSNPRRGNFPQYDRVVKFTNPTKNIRTDNCSLHHDNWYPRMKVLSQYQYYYRRSKLIIYVTLLYRGNSFAVFVYNDILMQACPVV